MLLTLIGCQSESVNAPEGFSLNPEFRMELIASEPLVFDPVDMEFDELGRAFVLEMPGYPLRDEESRLVLLEDRDGDGHFDHRQIFADSLQLASSFLPYRDGFLVAAPPDLLYIKDTDQDNVADEVERLMSGFSAGNLQHNFNGLTYGLDNWIYAANGGNSGRPYVVEDHAIHLDMRGDDFKFRPKEKELERVGESSGGFELAFDNWGRMYGTHNVKHVSHLVFPNRYLEHLPVSPKHSLTNISDHEENGLSRIYPIGEQESRVNHPEQSGYFSGACGITFYGGNDFPEGFNNHLFVADVVLNLIHLDLLSADKASFKTSRKRKKAEFLASSDRAFRPVNMTTGPDGSLYVLDMHREVIEHPEWIPDEIEKTLDLQAGKNQGRVYRILPKNSNRVDEMPHLNKEKAGDLVDALFSENQWTRNTAQRLLVEIGSKNVVPKLKEVISKENHPLPRLHAMWTLEGLKALDNELLLLLLKSPEAALTENALKIVELRLPIQPDLLEAVLPLLDHSNARVRMQAALCLSTSPNESLRVSLVEKLDQVLRHPENDRWVSLAVASVFQKEPLSYFSFVLDQKIALNDHQMEVAEILARVLGKENDQGDILPCLEALQENTNLAEKQIAILMKAMADGVGEANREKEIIGITDVLDKLEKEGDIMVLRASGRLRNAMNLKPSSKTESLLAKAKTEVLNTQLSTEERLARLQFIQLEEFSNRKDLLFTFLDNRQPLALQKEALEQLKESNDPDVGIELVNRWPELGPEARKRAGDILLYKSFNQELLLTALEDGRIKVGELNFDLERRRTLLFWSEPHIREQAKTLLADEGVVTRKAAIEGMRPALSLAGQIAKGKEIFTNLCSTCHQYGALGANVGPVLTEINRKSKEALLHEILDPNAAVDTKYLNHRIQLKDGNIVQGIIAQESDSELRLCIMGGQELTVSKDNIEEFASLGLSLMPEGLEANMSHQDMADLLAFLQQTNL